ncbi:lipoprotein signal peptidase [Marivirga lumbricoides]|uniref:Lipoprotein signal peptidase n=1 Tax=Marivirga lumbricoides TaxID=1046115 RepID=A0ABQ1M381_9BACT|nr:lipoprotein signal peptidase [Marivirga lumbricoides]
MSFNRKKRLILVMAILAISVIADQVSKIIIRNYIELHEQFSYLGGYFTITKVENSGAFLGMGDSMPEYIRIIVLIILPIVVMCYGIYFLITKKELPGLTLIGFTMMIGGGLGNIYDRIVYGSVTDFMHIDFGFAQTGIFNVADLSITTGAVLVLLQSFAKPKPKVENK